MPRIKEDRRQVEGLTFAEATALIDDIDTMEGYPRKGTFGAGAQHLEAACDAWLAGDRLGPPPPGITKTWAIPEEKHDDPGNHAVPLRPSHQNHISGRTIGGKLHTRGDFKVRNRASWDRPGQE